MLDHEGNANADGDGYDGDDRAPSGPTDKFSAGEFQFPPNMEENKSSLSDGGDMFDFSKSESDFD